MDPVTQGTLVAERYRLIREIGLGGMGTVWLAYDEALASRCAIKLLLPEPERNEEFALRLECEAKCGAQLRSPHVVDVLNRGYWHGKPFIVMEYMEGEDLSARLERVGRLDATTTYRIVAQVARALTRAHGLGIIHRDVKPANIFLVPGEEHEVAKVLDFGIAKHGALPNAFENPLEATFIGTPCYMSPEQAHAKTVDYRCDLWALAVITFECLTGSMPFPDESVVTVIRAIRSGNLPALTANHPELPDALEAWWRRATAKDIDARFQSAKEFADALGDALDAFPRMPISRPDRLGAGAPALLAPRELTPRPVRVPAAPLAADLALSPSTASNKHAVTLHAHSLRTSAQASRRESPRIPGRGQRGLFIVGAALCAALGFGASALRAEFDESGLYRYLSPGLPPAPGLTQQQVAASRGAPVELAVAAAVAEPEPKAVPIAAKITPALLVGGVGASTPVTNRAALRPAQPGSVRLRTSSSPAPTLTADQKRKTDVDAAESIVATPDAQSRSAPPPTSRTETLPGEDELPLRHMPPGEKDYGI